VSRGAVAQFKGRAAGMGHDDPVWLRVVAPTQHMGKIRTALRDDKDGGAITAVADRNLYLYLWIKNYIFIRFWTDIRYLI
jgi:hypothetical protein